MYSAPMPLGPPILWAETVMRSAPRALAEKGIFKKPWTASVWSRVWGFFAERPRAMSPMGKTFPSSLFTSITETSAVSGRTADRTSSAVMEPSA